MDILVTVFGQPHAEVMEKGGKKNRTACYSGTRKKLEGSARQQDYYSSNSFYKRRSLKGTL